jgi:Transposase IS116/IS110/IS902 family
MSIHELEPIDRLTKDIRKAADELTETEARYLVDLYYQIQEFRKACGNQIGAMKDEPTAVLGWSFDTMERIENEIKYWLDKYTDRVPVGRWSKSICGIGPVIAAGLLAHIDIKRAPTVGHIWRFAGLDPTLQWNKGEKRPFNASLKTLCWKIGESFVKVSANEKDIYGKIYLERKSLEISRNDEGAFSDQAKAKLEKFKIGKTTEAFGHYSGGKLPPAHIHSRAKRYAVKLFLSHWHAEAYRHEFGKEPPLPYPISHLGHVHMTEGPK